MKSNSKNSKKCKKCAYALGLVKTVINPCLTCFGNEPQFKIPDLDNPFNLDTTNLDKSRKIKSHE
ncbi:MAG: hypothetical protein LBM93_09975 [Oscillospiraceae bacterium]|nr:hypothetical protein [Oscillospiraceae bacterium]